MKKWLKRNKIFFEIFSYFFLGMASILVTFMSWRTSDKQLSILELEHQPIINLQRDYKGPFELITFENVGYHLFEQKIDVNSYFEIILDKPSQEKNKESKYLRVSDYFDWVSVTENTTGRIATMYSSEYYDKEQKRITQEFFSHPNYLDYRIELKSIVTISYKDELKNLRNKYYLINPFAVIEITKEQYDEKYKIIYDLYRSGLNKSIKDIKASDLIDLMKKTTTNSR